MELLLVHLSVLNLLFSNFLLALRVGCQNQVLAGQGATGLVLVLKLDNRLQSRGVDPYVLALLIRLALDVAPELGVLGLCSSLRLDEVGLNGRRLHLLGLLVGLDILLHYILFYVGHIW